MNRPTTSGFLLRCHLDGRIADILHDGIGLDARALVGRPFTMIVQPAGLPKALDFFAGIRRDGAQYLWELPVEPGGAAMVFIGALTDDGIAIAASVSHEGLGGFVDELMRINSEQANVIRQLYADRQSEPRIRPSDPRMADFARLNNDFANAQRELAKRNAELARLLEWRGLMLGMAAHDLQNPLNVISGFAELLQERLAGKLPEMEERALGLIRQSSAAMVKIIEDFLYFSRMETGNFSLDLAPAELDELVADAVAMAGMAASSRSVSVRASLPDKPVVASVDAGRVARVLGNLIGNAVKYSPDRGEVVVRLSEHPDRTAEISVADGGPGIPEAEMGRLFKPFSRTSVPPPSGEGGSGLGLAISRIIVEGHGGTISVSSLPGQGATFSVRLPL